MLLVLEGCCLTVASDGNFGWLQGPGSFSPNAVLAVLLSDGGVGTDSVIVEFDSSTPAFACADVNYASVFPDGGVVIGSVQV